MERASQIEDERGREKKKEALSRQTVGFVQGRAIKAMQLQRSNRDSERRNRKDSP